MYQMLIPLAINAATALMSKKQGGAGGQGGGSMPGGNMGKAGLSAVTGLVQNFQARKLKKEADALVPPLMDPNQAAFLSELNQKRKSIETGADFAAGMNMLNASNAGTNDAIVRAGGGDVGGTMQGLLRSQRTSDDARNNLLAQGANEQMAYNSMYGEFLNKIAARKLQLGLYKSQQARAEWAAKKKDANANLMAGMAGLTGMNGGGGIMGGSPSGTAPNVDTSVLQGMMNKTAGMEGSGVTGEGVGQMGEGVEGVTNAAAGMA